VEPMIERIDQMLKERGVSWRKLAADIGVSVQTTQNWKRGGKVKAENLEAVASYLGVTFAFLWDGTEEEDPYPSRAKYIADAGDLLSDSDRRSLRADSFGGDPGYWYWRAAGELRRMANNIVKPLTETEEAQMRAKAAAIYARALVARDLEQRRPNGSSGGEG